MINRQNYKDVLDYVDYHRKILQNTEATAEQKRIRLQNALIWADNVPFSECWKVKTPYPAYLDKLIKKGEISTDTANRLCIDLREFLKFQIIENNQRYNRLKMSYVDSIRIKTFTDTAKIAPYYTLDEMGKIANVTTENNRLKRTKAGACFLFLSGMRIGAFLSMPIECVNLDSLTVYQFPEMGVYTKFRKRAVTSLYNIPFLLDVVKEWDTFVRSKCPLGSTWYARYVVGGGRDLNPLFPEKEDRNEAFSKIANMKKNFYRNLQQLCQLADVDYKHPHAFRHGHVHYGLQNAHTAEQIKAVSQNVMHNSTAITDKIYSRMGGNDINVIITGLGNNTQPRNTGNAVTASDIIGSLSLEEKKKLLSELLGL